MPIPRTPQAEILSELTLVLLELQSAMAEKTGEFTAPHGQTPARWKVMAAAAAGVLTVPQIARRMGLTRQAVQKVANDLAADGLARFAPNPDHKASPHFKLTRRGAALEKKITGGYVRWANAFARGTDPKKIRAATRTLRALAQRLDSDPPRAKLRSRRHG